MEDKTGEYQLVWEATTATCPDRCTDRGFVITKLLSCMFKLYLSSYHVKLCIKRALCYRLGARNAGDQRQEASLALVEHRQ